MVRITAENLNVLTLRYAHQITTRNADSSELFLVIRKLRQQSEQTRSLTKCGGDRIRNHLELELHIVRAQAESVDREIWDVEERYGPDESRCERQD